MLILRTFVNDPLLAVGVLFVLFLYISVNTEFELPTEVVDEGILSLNAIGFDEAPDTKNIEKRVGKKSILTVSVSTGLLAFS